MVASDLSDPDVRVFVVEHGDRLVPFGAEHLDAVLAARAAGFVVADPSEATDDQERDEVDVLTSIGRRLHWRRGARDRVMRAVTAAQREPGEAP